VPHREGGVPGSAAAAATAAWPPGGACPTSPTPPLELIRRRPVRILGVHLRSPRDRRGIDAHGARQRLRVRLGDLLAEQGRVTAEVLDVALVEDDPRAGSDVAPRPAAKSPPSAPSGPLVPTYEGLKYEQRMSGSSPPATAGIPGSISISTTGCWKAPRMSAIDSSTAASTSFWKSGLLSRTGTGQVLSSSWAASKSEPPAEGLSGASHTLVWPRRLHAGANVLTVASRESRLRSASSKWPDLYWATLSRQSAWVDLGCARRAVSAASCASA